MALSFGTALPNKVLDTGWNTAWTNPVMEIREGPRPASSDDAVTGNLLCLITLPTTSYFAAAASGAKAKNGTWSGTVTSGGTPAWFRIRNSADSSGGSSTSNPRLDGSIGLAAALADLIVSSASWAINDTFTINTFTLSWRADGLVDVMLEGSAS